MSATGTTAERKRAAPAAQAWQGLRNPGSTGEYYGAWLALLCGGIRGTEAGLLLVRGADGTFVPAGLWPSPTADVSHLAPAAERALTERTAVVVPSPAGSQPARAFIAQPVIARDELIGAIVIDLASPQESEWRIAADQLAWASGWPEALYWRQQVEAQQNGQVAPAASGAEALVIDVLQAADQHDRFDVAAVLVANRIGARLEAERVTIGLAGRRGIALQAMSHSATFDRKSELVSGIENAMLEAFDQHDAVAFPPTETTAQRISVAHSDFVERWGLGAVASVILVAAGHPIGVLTLERPAGRTFEAAEIEQARLVGNAIGPVLDLKYRQGRLVSGRLLDATREWLSRLMGPDLLSLKLGVGALVLLLAFMTFWPSEFRISAKAVLEGSVQRAAVAPFDGFVAKAPLRAGDIVREGQELASLDDRDLLLEKVKWETERQKLVQRHRDALAKHERTNVLVIGTQVEQAQSQLDLVLEKLKRSRITAPIDGIIVSGDLTQMLGAPVQQGKVLFEIAPLSSYRLILQVDERDIGYLAAGRHGTLLLTGAASQGIDLEVSKLTSVSTPEDGRNYFRVEATIRESGQALRPGMEGIAKVGVDQRSLLWIWTRPLIDRLRMLIWTWTP